MILKEKINQIMAGHDWPRETQEFVKLMKSIAVLTIDEWIDAYEVAEQTDLFLSQEIDYYKDDGKAHLLPELLAARHELRTYFDCGESND